MRIRAYVVSVIYCLIFLQTGVSMAGEKGKIAAMLADYDDIKKRATTLISEAREARQSGYSSDPKEMQTMAREARELAKQIVVYIGEQDQQSHKKVLRGY